MDKQTEQARELLAQQRQQSELRQDAMLERSEEELHAAASSTIEQKARAAMANQLHEQEHSQDAMRERSEEEVHGA
jgi:hypothetical protein